MHLSKAMPGYHCQEIYILNFSTVKHYAFEKEKQEALVHMHCCTNVERLFTGT